MRNEKFLSITYALIQKYLLMQQTMIFWKAALLSWLERLVSDCKVAGSITVQGINANYLKGIFVVWKTSTGICFTTAYTGEKMKKTNKNKRTGYCRYLQKWV